MSNSPNHDRLFKLADEYAARNYAHDGMLSEPMRPRNWPKSVPWCSPDRVYRLQANELLSVDVKFTRGDLDQFMSRVYVRSPKYGVGRFRVLLYPSDLTGGQIVAPENFGVWFICGTRVEEVQQPTSFWRRNYMEEVELMHRLMRQEPEAQEPKKDQGGSTVARILRYFEEETPINPTPQQIRKAIRRPLPEVERALQNPRFLIHRQYGKRTVSLTEEATA